MKVIYGCYIVVCLFQIYNYYKGWNIAAMYEVIMQIGLVAIILAQDYTNLKLNK